LPKPLPLDPPILLYLGRLVKEKGIDVAISAFPRILARFPQTRMVIAGDGPERPSLEQQARSLGIRDSVDFLGWVSPDEVSDLINTASVVVIPSRWEEPFGFVALEAGLMARPVVATRVGGLQEIIVHSKTGLLVANEDKQELSEAIMVLLGNLSMAEQIGQTARCHVIEKFSLQQCVNAYDSLYQKLGNVTVEPKSRNLLKVHT
jgi:glycogen(starch) synthase